MSVENQTAEQQLVHAIKSGNANMWQYFIEKYEGRLLAFAQSRVADRAEAEDIVQDSFIGFLNSLPNFDGERSLESYLFSIVSYKITDYFRKRSRSRQITSFGVNQDGDEWSLPPLLGASRAVSSIARSMERRGDEEALMTESIRTQLIKWQDKGDWTKLKCLELLFVAGASNKSAAIQLLLSEQQVANYKSDFLERTKSLVNRTSSGG